LFGRYAVIESLFKPLMFIKENGLCKLVQWPMIVAGQGVIAAGLG
jgi:hypothetical protein